MANDIMLAINDQPIKNGTMIHSCNMYGTIVKQDTYVRYKPTIIDIQNKYDLRFDDPSYYYGTGSIDGGDVG